jgi:hypothetical protein
LLQTKNEIVRLCRNDLRAFSVSAKRRGFDSK